MDEQELLKGSAGKIVPGVGSGGGASRPLPTEGHVSVNEGKQRSLVPFAFVTRVVEEQKQINVEFFSSLS